MASKPPQLVCTQHPAPPVLPSLFGIMARSACAALHTRNVPAADMRRGTPFFQGAVGCLPGRPFRLHLIPRFPPAVLPQKSRTSTLTSAARKPHGCFMSSPIIAAQMRSVLRSCRLSQFAGNSLPVLHRLYGT
mgnify:CR=1 FL=1